MPTPARGARPVITDVARAAGVSHQTVSKVLNGAPGVGERTRRHVQEVIARLGYRPNAAARALAAGGAGAVHVLTTGAPTHAAAATLAGIAAAAAEGGQRIAVEVLQPGAPAALQAGTAGCIVLALDPAAQGALAELAPGGAVVAVGDGGPDVPWVGLAEEEAAQLATGHLLDLGHRTVHHIAAPGGAGRTTGWVRALRAAGRPVAPPVPAGWDARSGAEAAERLLARHPGATAVLCGSDDIALGALHVLRLRGRRVPEDVSVVGFDDAPGAAYFAPPLTTIRPDLTTLGRRALHLLQAVLAGAAPSGTSGPAGPEVVPGIPRDVPCEVVVRASTAPPPPG